jgi:hypothetical protein
VKKQIIAFNWHQIFQQAFQSLNKGGGSHPRAHYHHPCLEIRVFQPTIFLFQSQP